MYKLKKNEVYASEIAKYLNTRHIGNDIIVIKPSEIGESLDNVLCFCEEVTAELFETIDNHIVVIANENAISKKENITIIVSQNPRKDFYKIVNEFFVQGIPHRIDPAAIIKQGARIGMNVHVGRHTVIDDGVVIGNNTYIGNNVIISGCVSIGTGCIIKDGAIIGSEGFSFIEDEEEVIHIPQFGNVVIDNEVWIGANTTIERPFLGTTWIKKSVKIDDLVHIGQGSYIGESSQITAGCILASYVKIGECCFLGVGTSVKEQVEISDRAIIGMGSVVVSNLKINATYMGIPAKKMMVE